MTRRNIIKVTFILLTSFTFYTCTKDTVPQPATNEFCSMINGQDFDSTGTLIDAYLETQLNGTTDEKLDNLKNWLETNSCVTKAEVFCNSCMYSLPPQSEISVDFISNGQPITKKLYILMNDTLQFSGFH